MAFQFLLAEASINIGLSGVNKVTSGISQALTSFAELETTILRFQVLTKSDAAGSGLVKQIREFSKTSPLFNQELFEANKTLIAYGSSVTDAGRQVEKLSDIALGTGRDLQALTRLYGQMRSRSVIYTRDLNRVVNAGIDIFTPLQEITGKTTAQLRAMAAAGQFSSELMIQAFDRLTASGGQFQGVTEKLSQSMTGMTATIQDNIEALSTQAAGWIIHNAHLDDAISLFSTLTQKATEYFETNKLSIEEEMVKKEERRKSLAESRNTAGKEFAANMEKAAEFEKQAGGGGGGKKTFADRAEAFREAQKLKGRSALQKRQAELRKEITTRSEILQRQKDLANAENAVRSKSGVGAVEFNPNAIDALFPALASGVRNVSARTSEKDEEIFLKAEEAAKRYNEELTALTVAQSEYKRIRAELADGKSEAEAFGEFASQALDAEGKFNALNDQLLIASGAATAFQLEMRKMSDAGVPIEEIEDLTDAHNALKDQLQENADKEEDRRQKARDDRKEERDDIRKTRETERESARKKREADRKAEKFAAAQQREIDAAKTPEQKLKDRFQELVGLKLPKDVLRKRLKAAGESFIDTGLSVTERRGQITSGSGFLSSIQSKALVSRTNNSEQLQKTANGLLGKVAGSLLGLTKDGIKIKNPKDGPAKAG